MIPRWLTDWLYPEDRFQAWFLYYLRAGVGMALLVILFVTVCAIAFSS